MDANILAALMEILQKQSNSIRTLETLTVALGETLRKVAEEMGMEYEEFHKLFQESLSAAGKSEPPSNYLNVAKEIEETVELLRLLEKNLPKN